MQVNIKGQGLIAGIWLLIANLLLWAAQSGIWPAQILGFVSLVLLPGFALLYGLRLPLRSPLEVCLFGAGLGFFSLLLCGFVVNQLLFSLGVEQPLTLSTLWISWNLLTIGCICYGIQRQGLLTLTTRPRPTVSRPTAIFAIAACTVPLLAMFGANRLNNGGDNAVAMLAILVMALLLLYACIQRRHISDASLAIGIFAIGLGILLMTSLRSWDISGHDIAREFHVFAMTNILKHWDITMYRDPYNSCLSITILPHTLTTLLHVSGQMVFKVFMQVPFALCAVTVFMLLRRYVPKLGALLGVALFICYPTFINDAAMLTRQGLAYFFLALAVYVALHPRKTGRSKQLFLLLSFGVIVSHYSTAYLLVGIAAVAYGAKCLLQAWLRRKQQPLPDEESVFSFSVIVMLIAMAFIWNAHITATSGALTSTLTSSIKNIPTMLSDDNRSVDVSTSLFLPNNRSLVDLYDDYISRSQQSNLAAEYMPQITNDTIPLTRLGKDLRRVGINASSIPILRQSFAKVLQLLAVGGAVLLWYRTVVKRTTIIPQDMLFLSIASLALIGLMVAMPTISVNYGVLRAFQQGMIILIVPMILLIMYAGQRASRRVRTSATSIFVVFLFLLFTNWFSQCLGGTSPNLSLNNYGLYYGLYYTTQADLQAYAWLQSSLAPSDDVRAANFAKAAMHTPLYPYRDKDILPSQLLPSSYVYLDQAQMQQKKFYVYYDSSPIVMTFPLEYYQQLRNQIYSTGNTGVFQ